MTLEQFIAAIVVAAFDYSHHVRPREVRHADLHAALHLHALAMGRLGVA